MYYYFVICCRSIQIEPRLGTPPLPPKRTKGRGVISPCPRPLRPATSSLRWRDVATHAPVDPSRMLAHDSTRPRPRTRFVRSRRRRRLRVQHAAPTAPPSPVPVTPDAAHVPDHPPNAAPRPG